MEHFYENINGWFDFQDIYSNMVNMASDGYRFVEIGSWLGKSTSYMGVEIANSNKKIKFDCVDKWEYTPILEDFKSYDNIIKNENINPYDKFLLNIQTVKNYINPIIGDSSEVSKLYDNNSLNFVFIDADHSYEGVKKDITNWYPKIKNGGYIGGHDYYIWGGVNKAVEEYFKNDFKHICNSWLHKKL